MGLISSFSDLVTVHRALLKQLQSGEISSAVLNKIDEFLQSGVQAGSTLDAPDQRNTAQGLLDYWVATRSNLERKVHKEPAAASTPVGEALLVPFDEELLTRQVDEAERRVADLSADDQELARRLLLRLTQLDPATRTFTRRRARYASLISFGDAAQVTRILQHLVSAGVVQPIEETNAAADAAEVQFEIAHDALLRQWPRLHNWLERRRQFRDAAEFWANQSRDENALFDDGPLLEEALTYRDLGDLEQEFADASRNKRDRRMKRKLINLIIGLGVALLVAVAVLIIVFIAMQQSSRRAALEDEQSELVETTNSKITGYNDLLRAQEAASLRTSDELREVVQAVLASDTALESLPEETRKRVMEYRDEFVDPGDSRLLSLLQSGAELRPGFSVGGQSNPAVGSVGFFVEDRRGQVFLVAPRFVLGEPGTVIVQPGGPTKDDRVVGRVVQLSTGKMFQLTDLAFALVHNPQAADNQVPEIGPIRGIAGALRPGTNVVLVGRGSGIRKGKFIDVQNELLRFTEMSSPGDAGAPVLTESGLLVGLLMARTDEGSFAHRVTEEQLQELGLRLKMSGSETRTRRPSRID